MSDPLSSFDLKFLPDWLKESSPANPYADYQGDSRERSGRYGGNDRGRNSNDRGRGRRDDRRAPGSRPDSGRQGPRGNRDFKGQPRHQGDRRDQKRTEAAPANVKVEFLPDPIGAANIVKQIRQSGKTFPLLATARMFMEKPERHSVRITSLDADKPLFQINESPLSFDKDALERSAFRMCRKDYYREETVEIEPPKGNFTSVARCRSSGTLLGPTSHHAYQVAVRKLYEERFSRRMSFLDFQREEIEVVSGEQAVADWKALLSKQTVYHTTREETPVQFQSLQDAEAHFRKHYLPQLLKSAATLECSGKAARELSDRSLTQAVREAFERELAYPSGIVNALRPFIAEQNLQVFKHRKRILFISQIRPKRADSTAGFSEGPAHILTIVGENPRISKRDLALKILGEAGVETPEYTERKTQLASDLHYLVHAGFVIEFADGKLDLPLAPTPPNQPKDASSEESADTVEAGEDSGVEEIADPSIQADATAEDISAECVPAISSETPASESVESEAVVPESGDSQPVSAQNEGHEPH